MQVCSLIPGILETRPKEEIVAQSRLSSESQTVLPFLGADLHVPYELTLESLDKETFQVSKTGLGFFFNHNEHFSKKVLLT